MIRAYAFIILTSALIGALLPTRDADPPPAERDPIVVEPSGTASDGGQAAQPTYAPAIGPTTTLKRHGDGHYYADVEVNGVDIHVLVDTGASSVALSQADARRIGLTFSPSDFTVIGHGASGDVRGKFVTLDRVSLGNQTAENVEGAILEGSHITLLGQSFLNRLNGIETSGDTMVLR